MRYAYFIFILSLFGCLPTNAQANKDYKQVKADKIKKIIFFDVRDTDTISKYVREYDKKGCIVKCTDYSIREEQLVPVIQKKYASDCNGDCTTYEETREYSKYDHRRINYSLGAVIHEHRYTGTGNKRELSAYRRLEQFIEIEREKSKATKEDMYGYLYLFPKFNDEVNTDSSNLFAQYKSVTNYSFIYRVNTEVFGEHRIYLQPLVGDSIPINIGMDIQNDSLVSASASYLFATGKRTFTIRSYKFIFNKIPVYELSFNFMDSNFHSSLNKLFHISQKANLTYGSSRIITYTSGKFKLVTRYYMYPEYDKYPEEDTYYDSTVTKYKRNHSSYTMKVFNNGKQIKTHTNDLNNEMVDYLVWDTYLELKRSHYSKEYKLEYW